MLVYSTVVLAHNMAVLGHNMVEPSHDMIEASHSMFEASHNTVEQAQLSTVTHSMVVHWAADWSRNTLAKPKDEIVREGKRVQLRN